MTGPMPSRKTSTGGESLTKIGMDRNQSATAVLGRMIAQLDHRTDTARRIEHHVPGQLRDLTGAQARLGGEQDDQPIAEGVPGAAGKH